MNVTYDSVIHEVRRLIADRGKPSLVPESLLEEMVAAALTQLQSEGAIMRTFTPAFVTLAPGVDSYTLALPAGIDSLASIDSLHNDAIPWPIYVNESLDMVHEARRGGSVISGPPRVGALYVNAAGETKLELYPAPAVAYVMDAYTRQVQGAFKWSTRETLVLTQDVFDALKWRAASITLLSVSEATVAKLGFSPSAAEMYGKHSLVAVDRAVRTAVGSDAQDSIVRLRR